MKMSGDEADGVIITGASVNAAAAKLSLFFNTDPVRWFRHADIKFAIANITSSRTKACYTSSCLYEATDLLVADVPLDGEDPYGDYRRILVEARGTTKRDRIDDLMASPMIGAEGPMDFAARIRSFLKDVTTDDIGKDVFMRGVAMPVSTLLRKSADAAGTMLEDLAREAMIYYAQGGVAIPVEARAAAAYNVASSSPQPPPPPPSPAVNAANRFPPRGGARPRQNYLRPPHFQNPTPAAPPAQRKRQGGGDAERFSLCSFHARFGPNAHSCMPPCLMGNANAGGRR